MGDGADPRFSRAQPHARCPNRGLSPHVGRDPESGNGLAA